MIIGIIGLGLIGGSLAIDLRSLGHKILGVSRKQTTCEQAIARGIVDDASTDLKILSSAEVIFICTPIEAIAPTIQQLIPYISTDTILTDVGSVKKPIVDVVAGLWDNFIGGHPMAGTADSGLDAALSNLFVDRCWCITPTNNTQEIYLNILTNIITSVQAKIIFCQPQEHDQAVALISHLPVMISSSLIATCLAENDLNVLNLAKIIASSGFKDTSRVGGGNPELGLMMAKYNRQALLTSLYQYQEQLNAIVNIIETENWSKLNERLTMTNQGRTEFTICQQ
jgi:arogenate dehydrogenase (NADP+)